MKWLREERTAAFASYVRPHAYKTLCRTGTPVAPDIHAHDWRPNVMGLAKPSLDVLQRLLLR